MEYVVYIKQLTTIENTRGVLRWLCADTRVTRVVTTDAIVKKFINYQTMYFQAAKTLKNLVLTIKKEEGQ